MWYIHSLCCEVSDLYIFRNVVFLYSDLVDETGKTITTTPDFYGKFLDQRFRWHHPLPVWGLGSWPSGGPGSWGTPAWLDSRKRRESHKEITKSPCLYASITICSSVFIRQSSSVSSRCDQGGFASGPDEELDEADVPPRKLTCHPKRDHLFFQPFQLLIFSDMLVFGSAIVFWPLPERFELSGWFFQDPENGRGFWRAASKVT